MNKKTDIEIERAKFEQEKMTRRAALRKFGLTTGMSVFGLFAVDDLAKVVIAKMKDNEATKAIAENLAHEFRNAGAVFASTPCVGLCDDCCTRYAQDLDACLASYTACINAHKPKDVCDNADSLCYRGASEADADCRTKNHCGNCLCSGGA